MYCESFQPRSVYTVANRPASAQNTTPLNCNLCRAPSRPVTAPSVSCLCAPPSPAWNHPSTRRPRSSHAAAVVSFNVDSISSASPAARRRIPEEPEAQPQEQSWRASTSAPATRRISSTATSARSWWRGCAVAGVLMYASANEHHVGLQAVACRPMSSRCRVPRR